MRKIIISVAVTVCVMGLLGGLWISNLYKIHYAELDELMNTYEGQLQDMENQYIILLNKRDSKYRELEIQTDVLMDQVYNVMNGDEYAFTIQLDNGETHIYTYLTEEGKTHLVIK